MTRKDFIRMAEIMKYCKPWKVVDPRGFNYYFKQWEVVVQELAKDFEKQNPRLKRQLWLDYINGKSTVKGREI